MTSHSFSSSACGPCGPFRFQVVPDVRVGLLHLERKRPWPSCPNPDTGNQWSYDMKEKILAVLKKTPFQLFRADQAARVDDDPSLRVAVAHCRQSGVDVLVACQPVISDGRLAPVLAQQWGHDLVMWATPEEQTGQMISGNSLVGTHLMSANLRQLGFPVQLVYANLNWSLCEAQLLSGVRLAFARRYLGHAKLGLVGYQAPGFQDFHPDPVLLRKNFGALLLHIGLAEYVQLARAVSEAEVQQDVRHVVHDLKVPLKALESDYGVEEADLGPASRHYLAMKELIRLNNLDGLAVRCWPELSGPDEAGGLDQWCYMALARLATEGFPIACEGDVDGSLGALVAKFLGCGAVYLSDWLEHDAQTLTLWHGGMAPFQLSSSLGTPLGPCLSRHFNNKKAGCVDATIRPGMDVTVFRFWVFQHQYHAVVLEGRTIEPKRHLLGNNGLVDFSGSGPSGHVDLIAAFDRWLQHGFPHHVNVVQGRHAKVITAFAEQSGVKIMRNN